MSQKRKGQLSVSGEWARHLRPFLRRLFWKGERQAEKSLVREESASMGSEDKEMSAVETRLEKTKMHDGGRTQ